jgi:hypothetical protein
VGVMEPAMNGIGGDLFVLYWDAKAKKLYGLNASGWAPTGLTPALLASKGVLSMPARRRLLGHGPRSRGRMAGAARQVRDQAALRAARAGDPLREAKASRSARSPRRSGPPRAGAFPLRAPRAPTCRGAGRPWPARSSRTPTSHARSRASRNGDVRASTSRRDSRGDRPHAARGRRHHDGAGPGRAPGRVGRADLDDVSRLDRLRDPAEHAGHRGTDDARDHGGRSRSASGAFTRRGRSTR